MGNFDTKLYCINEDIPDDTTVYFGNFKNKPTVMINCELIVPLKVFNKSRTVLSSQPINIPYKSPADNYHK
jgi:hypothetical protein